MNATRTSEPVSALTVAICTTFPVLLLLFICCVIFFTAERGKLLPRATVVVPIGVEAHWVDTKVVPPVPEM